LKKAVDPGAIKIVANQHITVLKAEEALKTLENALTQNNDDIQAVVVLNERV
jgi:D-xylose transport system substrate-binding protein